VDISATRPHSCLARSGAIEAAAFKSASQISFRSIKKVGSSFMPPNPPHHHREEVRCMRQKPLDGINVCP
jgi:hypothetical protein